MKNKKKDLVIAIGMVDNNKKKKKKKKMAMGGMMPMQERKINPSTGLAMNKGGMTDMGESGTFYPHPLKLDLRDAFAEAGKKLSEMKKIRDSFNKK